MNEDQNERMNERMAILRPVGPKPIPQTTR